MERFLGRYTGYLYPLMRFIAGFLFTCHGLQKMFGVLGGHVVSGDPLHTAAGVIELVAGVMIAVGWLTGYAAFLASGQMAVAYFKAHAPHGFWPIENHGELAALYCFVFLYMASRGSGRFSVDALVTRRARPGAAESDG